MALRISVFQSKDLAAAILALKGADKAINGQVRVQTRKVLVPGWQEAVRGHVTTRQEDRVLAATARVAVSGQNITLSSGTVGRAMSGGAKPRDIIHNVEFGADKTYRRPKYESRSRKGKSFTVKNRRTRAQFRPRNRTGYVVYPAAADFIPRAASLWIQTIGRTMHEQLERR